MTRPEEITPDVLEALAGWRAGRILDVRPAAAFARQHLRGAVSLPLEPCGADPGHFAAAIPSIFLPPRHEPLLVVASVRDVADGLAAHLRARGRTGVDALVQPGPDIPLPAALTASGPSRDRLWSPPEWLSRHADLLPPPALGPALDLACGSGRAAVWLAAAGWRVTALDHQVEALDLGRRLAASASVAVDFAAADLRRPQDVPPGPWALVVSIRFLERPLLARLGGLLMPGGVACLRTFRDPPGYRGHPQPRHRLDRGELMAAFAGADFEVLAHDEGFDADGLPAAGIVARRRGPAGRPGRTT
ncbi:MAG TPA: methyltransferase domain-containing protein [Candidatus Krumholzibacteria bacterium]|nr:methyltransferase domain-containing protein [Candidatus Krumholzibacteria bacterium]